MEKRYERKKTCAVIGSAWKVFRVENHKLRLAVLSVMEEAIRHHSIKKFLTAVNPGVEMLAVECANALNVFYPGITVEAVVPYEEQHVVWNIEEQERFRKQ
ncbi:DUF1273 domain-containing protein [Oscillospiraceae bacterium OttesenSCG-928-F05]|nr:DUF1273 domain-containing protein [Oscillospiraceae bacterium OttesenSCG-928-F05]